MPGLLNHVDPSGLLEYSVVYTDRALNHMSQEFQTVMRDISHSLKSVYSADSAVVVPGSGTFAMEAVARQFANNENCLIIRNGWFSYRWSQILDAGSIAAKTTVLKAQRSANGSYAPTPVESVVETIKNEKPAVVFAPHVETASGMMLPESYIRSIGQAAKEVGALFVLDSIASGAEWVNMSESNVDVLISAPQKGWSASPCCGLVMMNERALTRLSETESSSFACNLKQWHKIMEAYLAGNHAYYATMPTDALKQFRNTIKEMKAIGFDNLKMQQRELGKRIRKVLSDRGFQSVADNGFEAAGVVVSYTEDAFIKSGAKFKEFGMQIAAGVPLQCDEPEDFQTFRLGLFGIDKLQNISRTVRSLEAVLKEF